MADYRKPIILDLKGLKKVSSDISYIREDNSVTYTIDTFHSLDEDHHYYLPLGNVFGRKYSCAVLRKKHHELSIHLLSDATTTTVQNDTLSRFEINVGEKAISVLLNHDADVAGYRPNKMDDDDEDDNSTIVDYMVSLSKDGTSVFPVTTSDLKEMSSTGLLSTKGTWFNVFKRATLFVLQYSIIAGSVWALLHTYVW